jgi:hypothetical protein
MLHGMKNVLGGKWSAKAARNVQSFRPQLEEPEDRKDAKEESPGRG